MWGRVTQTSVESFSLRVLKTSVEEPFCVSDLFPYRKKFTHTREISGFSVGTMLSHSPLDFHRGTLLRFRKSPASRIFMHSRGYHVFLSQIFCLAVAKGTVEKPFCMSKKFCYRKELWICGEVNTIFR